MALSLLASTPGNAEASQIIGTVNSLVVTLNSVLNLTGVSSAQNQITISNASSGQAPNIGVAGAANLDLTIQGAGTGHVIIGGSSLNAPLLVTQGTASTADQIQITAGSSGQNLVSIQAQGSDTNINVAIGGLGSGGVLLGGANSLLAPFQVVQATASTADFVQVTGGTSGAQIATITAGGSDASINLVVQGKGASGGVLVGGANSLTAPFQIVQATASTADNIVITGGTSGANLVTLATAGSDTNIDLAIAAKGSGLLRFNNTTNFTANSNIAISITALGPAALISSTISKWLTVKDSAGGLFYIPCFH